MVTTVGFCNISITPHNYPFLVKGRVRTFKIYSLSNFQMYNTVLLTIVTIRLVERKVCFISEASNGRTPVQGLTPPPLTISGQESKSFYRWREGLHAKTAQSALTVTLKLVMQWSNQCHLDCFKYS